MQNIPLTAVLLLSCADRQALVADYSNWIASHGGNILSLNEHVDTEHGLFFLRVAWDMKDFIIQPKYLAKAFEPMARKHDARWQIKFLEEKERMAIFVSKYDHCLRDILWRHSMDEFIMEVPIIISNHPDMLPVAERYGIPYFEYNFNKKSKADIEQEQLELLREHRIDSIILARYMQILSSDFVSHYPNRIINIHHSFLPAFAGSNPYRQAYDKGVKIIGATSHYVTEDLDEGPIIEQGITRISHKDTVPDLIRKGRDLERLVLATAIRYHSEHRILVHGRKTVIFD